MTRKVLVNIKALLALNRTCKKKIKNFLDNTNFTPYALTKCAPETFAVFFFIHELAFYICVGSVPNLLLFLFCTSQELV